MNPPLTHSVGEWVRHRSWCSSVVQQVVGQTGLCFGFDSSVLPSGPPPRPRLLSLETH